MKGNRFALRALLTVSTRTPTLKRSEGVLTVRLAITRAFEALIHICRTDKVDTDKKKEKRWDDSLIPDHCAKLRLDVGVVGQVVFVAVV